MHELKRQNNHMYCCDRASNLNRYLLRLKCLLDSKFCLTSRSPNTSFKHIKQVKMSASGRMGGYDRRRRHGEEDPMVKLSKSLSWLLRHGPKSGGLELMYGGFLFVDEILKLPQFKNFTQEQIENVVASNDKKRFALEVDDGSNRLKIRANQGHSVSLQGLQLTKITAEDNLTTVVHGTYFEAWEHIKVQGLKRMERNHVHFALGEPSDDGVISGMRSSCEVMIFIDMEAALKGGLEFFRSANNVILCPGNKDGVIPVCFFKEVIQRNLRQKIPFDVGTDCSLQSVSAEKLTAGAKVKKRRKNRISNV